MALPTSVSIIEVGPRDGLQSIKQFIPTPLKIEFINKLSLSGLTTIETTSFVSTKKVPQMRDHVEVVQSIISHPHIQYPVLVPNQKGLSNALACGVKSIAVFTTSSESFAQKNTNTTVDESMNNIKDMIALCLKQKINVRAYLSCCFDCPYEGKMQPEKTVALAHHLRDMGVNEISIGDTLGKATENDVGRLISMLVKDINVNQLALHFHNTYGHALKNIEAALHLGISRFDSSAAGLGGCPFAPGASGNVATEDIVMLMEHLNISTGIDYKKLQDASRSILDYIQQSDEAK